MGGLNFSYFFRITTGFSLLGEREESKSHANFNFNQCSIFTECGF